MAGGTVVSPGLGDPNFDVGWWFGNRFFVCEVKSLPKYGETGQLRLGLGQVLDYADQIMRSGRTVQPVLLVEREVVDLRWVDVCDRAGVRLTWPARLGDMLASLDRHD